MPAAGEQLRRSTAACGDKPTGSTGRAHLRAGCAAASSSSLSSSAGPAPNTSASGSNSASRVQRGKRLRWGAGAAAAERAAAAGSGGGSKARCASKPDAPSLEPLVGAGLNRSASSSARLFFLGAIVPRCCRLPLVACYRYAGLPCDCRMKIEVSPGAASLYRRAANSGCDAGCFRRLCTVPDCFGSNAYVLGMRMHAMHATWSRRPAGRDAAPPALLKPRRSELVESIASP